MLEIIEKIKELYAELEKNTKEVATRLLAIKKSEDSLQDRHRKLDVILETAKERDEAQNKRDKEIGGAVKILARLDKLEEDEKELRRRNDIHAAAVLTFESYKAEEEQKLADLRNQLLVQKEAIDQERSTYKQRMGEQVIADFLAKHGAKA